MDREPGLPNVEAIPRSSRSRTRPEDRTQALNAGFTLHIGKPVFPADLVEAVRTLLAS